MSAAVVALLLQPLVGEGEEGLDGAHRVGGLGLGPHLADRDEAPRVQVEDERRGLELRAPQLEAHLGEALAGRGEGEDLLLDGVRPRGRRAVHLEGRLHVGEDGADALPLVDAADALQDHRGHQRLEGDEDVLGELPLPELELARGPEEEVVDRLLGLGLERAPQVVLG